MKTLRLWSLFVVAVMASAALGGLLYLLNANPDLLSAVCSKNDADGIACLRAWIDPVAALFTVVAIGYAALQLFESNRTANAAVRTSLVQMRTDYNAELRNVTEIMERTRPWLEATYPYIFVSSRTLQQQGDDYAPPDVVDLPDAITKLDLSILHQGRMTIREFTGTQVNEINQLRTGAIYALTEAITLFAELQDRSTFLLTIRETAEDDKHDENLQAKYDTNRERVGEVLGHLYRQLDQSGYSAPLVSYSNALTSDLMVTVDAIAELDSDVTNLAKAIHRRNLKREDRIRARLQKGT